MNVVQCAYLGRLEQLQDLVENQKVDVNTRDAYGDTALHAACAKGRTTMIKYLLEHGADVKATNNAGSTPLHKATLSKYDQITIVRSLLNKGADPNVKNNGGLYAEDLCKDFRLKEILLGEGAEVAKIEIPQEMHGRIIGKKGATLKSLCHETSTIITVPNSEIRSKEITIRGRSENVEIAKKRIQQLAAVQTEFAHENRDETSANFTTTRIQVPKEHHKRIVGKGGQRLRDIIGQRNVQIFVPKPDDPDDTIRFKGDIEDVNVAVKLLLAAAEVAPNTRGPKPNLSRENGFANGKTNNRPRDYSNSRNTNNNNTRGERPNRNDEYSVAAPPHTFQLKDYIAGSALTAIEKAKRNKPKEEQEDKEKKDNQNAPKQDKNRRTRNKKAANNNAGGDGSSPKSGAESPSSQDSYATQE